MRASHVRAAALTTSVALAAASPAAVAAPPGAPELRVARTADQAAQPAMYDEWWTLRLLDPRSDAMVELRVVRGASRTAVDVRRRRPDGTEPHPAVAPLAGPTVTTTARTLTATGQQGQGRAAIALAGRGGTVELQSDLAAGRVSLRDARPGPAALDTDLGEGLYNPEILPRISLSWAMPIARSTAAGSLVVQGETVAVDGWRATYEHAWGQFLPEDGAHDNLDTWTVHDRGTTWVVFGVNRTDTVTGPGARDAMWLGVLARAGSRGTRLCRPRIQRRGWIYDYLFRGPTYATRLDARCGRTRTALADVDRLRVEDDYGSFFEAHGPATVRGRGDGWVLHR